MSDLLQPNFEKGNGVLPAIAQDAQTGQVLMLAWMNREAWQETMATGRAVYYSRSRRKLWRKGEESGHAQRLVEVRLDCDADTILLSVEQIGAACHEGYRTCFYRRVQANSSYEIVEEQMKDPEEIYGKAKQ